MNPGIVTLQVVRGLPLLLPVSLWSDDLGTVPVNLAGCQVDAAIGAFPLRTKVMDITAIIVDAAGGRIDFTLTAEETAALPDGTLIWDVVVTDANEGPLPIITGPVHLADNANVA